MKLPSPKAGGREQMTAVSDRRQKGMVISMEINGYTRVCGLLGNPVEHTMSPVIHNTLSEKLGKNIAYVPFHVPAGHVKEAVEGAFALNLLGMNVTVPYKSEVIPFLKEIDPLAEQIGAVNTLVRTEGGYRGYNTDMPGLYRAMCEDGVDLEGEKVLILGAGGVARAVAMLFARKGAAQILILNRSADRAAAVAEEVNGIAGKQLARALPLAEHGKLPMGEKYLAVQATNVGMFPHVEDAVIEDELFYRKIHTGYDLIFNPAETRFMQKVRQSGGRAFGGMKMLLYQGIIAYELWTDVQVGRDLAAELYGRLAEAMKENGQGFVCGDKCPYERAAENRGRKEDGTSG